MERLDGRKATLDVEHNIAGHRVMVDAVERLKPQIVAAADLLAGAFGRGKKLLVCGNGGSAADAQHIAAEFVGRFLMERKPMPALALHTNTSAVTAIGNDYGFEEVFARQVLAHGAEDDVLWAISTSGKSPNVLRAMHAARETRMRVIAMTGAGGGDMAKLCDVLLAVDVPSTPRVQEGHILIAHIICGLVEEALWSQTR